MNSKESVLNLWLEKNLKEKVNKNYNRIKKGVLNI